MAMVTDRKHALPQQTTAGAKSINAGSYEQPALLEQFETPLKALHCNVHYWLYCHLCYKRAPFHDCPSSLAAVFRLDD